MPIPPYVAELRDLVGTRELWLPGVTAVVCRGDEVLLTRRADNGQWAPVTGISEDRLAAVGASPRITYENGDHAVYLDVTFACTWLAGEARVGDDENLEVRWWPVAALPPMSPWLLERIEAALAA